jgi:predicted Holliday junction resolvase-like endonuclease
MTNDAQFQLIQVLVLVIVALIIALIVSVSRSGKRAAARFEQWRTNELQLAKRELERALIAEYEVKMMQWKGTHEANIRADAVIRSSAVIKGRVSEHLAPYIHFPYNPRDARFIGSPIDIIVFNGLEDGQVSEIVFLEVKTGEGAFS